MLAAVEEVLWWKIYGYLKCMYCMMCEHKVQDTSFPTYVIGTLCVHAESMFAIKNSLTSNIMWLENIVAHYDVQNL